MASGVGNESVKTAFVWWSNGELHLEASLFNLLSNAFHFITGNFFKVFGWCAAVDGVEHYLSRTDYAVGLYECRYFFRCGIVHGFTVEVATHHYCLNRAFSVECRKVGDDSFWENVW